jgi:hypothetical protein
MRVYATGQRNHTVYARPAVDANGKVLDGVSHWKDPAGAPTQFAVRFIEGIADVPDELGNWLIKNGLAKRTKLILPRFALAA